MESNGIFGEGDFVIVDPGRGLLAVEVKGGTVEKRGGQWFQNGEPMRRPARDRGHTWRLPGMRHFTGSKFR